MSDLKTSRAALPTAADILAATARISALEKVTPAATRPTLPYFAPAELRPAPLPTPDQILSFTKNYNRTQVILQYPPLPFNEHFDIDVGKDGDRFQAYENMLFVQQTTNIPVPKLYAMFCDEETGYDFVILEHIPKEKQLEYLWDRLDKTQKHAIALQTRRYIDELRSIPSPGYYGGIWRQRVTGEHFDKNELSRGPHPYPIVSGPHETEEKWTEAMLHCVKPKLVSNKIRDCRRAATIECDYRSILKGHESVFTHAKLGLSSFVLRQDGTIVVTDWENSGWYPSYWEYGCAMMLNLRWGNFDWQEWAHEVILDQYRGEYLVMNLHMELLESRSSLFY